MEVFAVIFSTLLLIPCAAAQSNTASLDSIGTTSTSNFQPHYWNQTKELNLKIVEELESTLTLNMEQQKQINVEYLLYCLHPSVRYSISLRTGNSVVATVDDSLFYVSCKDALVNPGHLDSGSNANDMSSDGMTEKEGASNGTDGDGKDSEKKSNPLLKAVPVVQGTLNFTVYADLLGRTWLYVLGERQSDPDVALPDFITLPWKTPKSLSTLNNPASNVTIAKPSESESSPVTNDASYDVIASDDVTVHELQKHVVTVMRIIRPVDRAFRIILYSFVILNTVGMGCKTEVAVVKEVLRKPIAPAIGFFCQYLFMPLIAFMLAKTLTIGDPAVSLGIFACGICPGGGPSNMFSYLLDGDVSLSVTMTAISSIAALAMIPLWMFTLGEKFEDDKISLNVPFGKIIMTLAIIIIPLFIGAGIKRFLPKVAKLILKMLKPFTLVAVLFIVSFGIYANLYVFRLFAPRTLAAGCMLPYIGYTLGAIVSLIFRQPCYRVKTIAIETGIQNTSIAYLLLVFSLPAPDGDMAAVGPMASAIMTPLPLFVLVIVYLLYKRFCKKEEEKGEDGEEEEEENGGSGDGGEEGKGDEKVALQGRKSKSEGNGKVEVENEKKELENVNGTDAKGKDPEQEQFLDNGKNSIA